MADEVKTRRARKPRRVPTADEDRDWVRKRIPLERLLLTPRQAAIYMQASVASIYAWVDAGRLKAEGAGGALRLRLGELDRFLAAIPPAKSRRKEACQSAPNT